MYYCCFGVYFTFWRYSFVSLNIYTANINHAIINTIISNHNRKSVTSLLCRPSPFVFIFRKIYRERFNIRGTCNSENFLQLISYTEHYIFHSTVILTLSAPQALLRFFANNADSCESARNELSHLKSSFFAF